MVVFWCSDCGPNSLFCFTLTASNLEICAAHRGSSSTSCRAHSSTRVFWCRALSQKAQCQALPGNPETGDTYHTSNGRERSCALWRENRKWSTKKTYPSGTANTTRHATASNTIIGRDLYEYVGSLLLLLPQRAAIIVTTRIRPRQTRHGLSEGRGVAQFPPSWQAGWYVMSVIRLLAAWMGPFYKTNYSTCSIESS